MQRTWETRALIDIYVFPISGTSLCMYVCMYVYTDSETLGKGTGSGGERGIPGERPLHTFTPPPDQTRRIFPTQVKISLVSNTIQSTSNFPT